MFNFFVLKVINFSVLEYGEKYFLKVKKLLKSDYPPPKEVALTPIFASHRKFLRPTKPYGQSPALHDHLQRRWIFKFD